MDWNAAIEKNREALKRVLAMLVAMTGLGEQFFPQDGTPSQGPALAEKNELSPAPTLPRRLHRAVMCLLRPAEAAVRRLIIVAARGLVVAAPAPPRPRKAKPGPLSIFVRNGKGTGIVLPRGVKPWDILPGLTPPRPRSLALALFDPLPGWGGRVRPVAKGVPRISVPGYTERFPLPAPLSARDPIDARRLLLRFQTLARVLDDLPREARRFARWRAARDAAGTQNKESPDAAGAQNKKTRRPFRRVWPLKPGRPPGWRRKPSHEVHEVLNVVHGLAIWAMERPDTS